MTKTRKRTKPVNVSVKLVKTLLEIQHKVKIVHWATKSYNEHMATNTLYGALQINIDAIVEKSNLTTKEMLSLLSVDDISKSKLDKYLNDAITKLEKIRISRELDAIVDVIIGDIRQALYIMDMKYRQ